MIKFILNGIMIEKDLYSVLEEKSIEWAEAGITVVGYEESETVLTVGLTYKRFKSLLVKTTGKTGECLDCFVRLGEKSTLILGQWGTNKHAPLYRYE